MSKPRQAAGRGGRATGGQAVEQRIRVSFDYPVWFTRGVFECASPILETAIRRKSEGGRVRALAFVDSGVASAVSGLPVRISDYFAGRPAFLELAAPPVVLPGGEGAKLGWRTVKAVIRAIGRARLCRHSVVLVVGGGGILDAVGLAAALVHRGLRLVRIPTTAIAQNDVGVGVKNGIDAGRSKNFIGTFAPPFAVVNDFEFLRHVDDRDWRGGIAEAFKVAIIKDRRFFDFLSRHAEALRDRDEGRMERLIRRCAELHLEHIRTGGDPFEMGSARPLDFGHWVAHKLESVSDYKLGHGQAVAIGIAVDSVYARRTGLLSPRELARILEGLRASGLPIWDRRLAERAGAGRLRVLDGLEDFRVHLGGVLTVTLPDGIGRRTEVHHMASDIIEQSIRELQSLASGRGRP